MADHSGWLVKKAVKSILKENWKKRWVTIRENMMTYAVKPGASPKAMLTLTKDTVVGPTRKHGPKRPFELMVKDPAFTLYACASSEADREVWLAALQRAVDKTKPVAPRDHRAEEEALRLRMEELRLQEDLERKKAHEKQRRVLAEAKAITTKRRPAANSTAAMASASSTSASSDDASPEEQRRLKRAKSIRRRMAKMQTVATRVSAPSSDDGKPGPAKSAGEVLFDAASSVMTEAAAAHVVAQGANEAGQLGNNSTAPGGQPKPLQVAVLEGARTPSLLAMGKDFALAASDDAVFVWGNGASGQLGVAAGYTGALRPFPNPHLRDRKVRSIACGSTHAILADNMGQVFTMGSSALGALGQGAGVSRSDTPQLVLAGADAAAVRAGGDSSAVISTAGALFRWGSNNSGLSGYVAADGTGLWKPLRMEDELVRHGVVDVAFAGSFTMILTAVPSAGAFARTRVHPQSGRRCPVPCQLLVCGAPGAPAEHFDAHREAFTSPHHTRTFADRAVVSGIAGGEGFGLVLAEGSVHALGTGMLAQATTNPAEVSAEHPLARANLQELEASTAFEPVRVPDLDLEDVEQMACGRAHAMVLTRRGAVLGWGVNTLGVLGTGTSADQQSPAVCSQVRGHVARAVVSGGSSSMCLVEQGTVAHTSRSRRLASMVAKHLHALVVRRRAAAPAAAGAAVVAAAASPSAPAAAGAARRFSTGAKATVSSAWGQPSRAGEVEEIQEQIAQALAPAAVAEEDEEAEAPTEADADERGGWRRHFDGETPYYEDLSSGATQWEAPPPFL